MASPVFGRDPCVSRSRQYFDVVRGKRFVSCVEEDALDPPCSVTVLRRLPRHKAGLRHAGGRDTACATAKLGLDPIARLSITSLVGR